jgi:hypothetical protein
MSEQQHDQTARPGVRVKRPTEGDLQNTIHALEGVFWALEMGSGARMRLLALELSVLSFLALGGCVSDQKQALAQCIREVQRLPSVVEIFPGVRDELHMFTCMEAKGYEVERLEQHSKKCAGAGNHFSYYVWCYHPMGRISRAAFWLEARFD